MVGIVVISHSQKAAEGTVELAKMMAPEAPIVAAGGMEDGGLGTSFDKIHNAVDAVYSDDGVAFIMDMGSAVMTAEMVLEAMDDKKLAMLDCPMVEGAIIAAVEVTGGATLDELPEKVAAARDPKL